MSWLTALQYGLPGLSGVMLILSFRIIQTEQRRTTPRQSMLRHTIIFMAFAFALLVANIFIQIIENQKEAAVRQTGAVERQTDIIQRQADAECAGALKALRSTIEGKVRYEFNEPNPDHSQLQATITALVEQSEASLVACRVLH
ncbi:hypothetical protein [Pseudomonas sp. LB3P14]